MWALPLKALIMVLKKMLITAASEAMIEYALFAIADVAVKSTATDKDDAWLKEFKERYEQPKSNRS